MPSYVTHGRHVWKFGSKSKRLLFNDWDLICILSGEMTIELAQQRIVASPGRLVLIPPFLPVLQMQTRSGLEFWYCHFAFRVLKCRRDVAEDFSGPGADLPIPMVFRKDDALEVWRGLHALNEIQVARLHPWRLQSQCLAMVSEVVRFANAMPSGTITNLVGGAFITDSRMRIVKERIDRNPVRQWRVSELAKGVGISTATLHKISLQTLNVNLKKYIIQVRLQRASELLRLRKNGERPSVKEVSNACGFRSQQFFSRQFKMHFLRSPGEYRDSEVPID